MDDRPELLKEAGVEDPFMLNRKLKREMLNKQNKRERANKLRVVNKSDKANVPGVIGISNKGRHEKKKILKEQLALLKNQQDLLGSMTKRWLMNHK